MFKATSFPTLDSRIPLIIHFKRSQVEHFYFLTLSNIFSTLYLIPLYSRKVFQFPIPSILIQLLVDLFIHLFPLLIIFILQQFNLISPQFNLNVIRFHPIFKFFQLIKFSNFDSNLSILFSHYLKFNLQ